MSKIKFYFQGEKGAFSEEAGFNYFGTSAEGIPTENFVDVVRNVVRNKNSFGILPIENSSIGSIHTNYDLLLQYPVFIVGEINLIVKQHLIGLKGISISKIKKIISHPAAIQQCQKFLNSLKKVKVDLSYDTAGSVKLIKENRLIDTAAISSEISAKLYDMKILRRNIQDNDKNITRFIVIASRMKLPEKNPKTSIVFTLKNVPGALFRALSVFALRDIDLTKIESRPIPDKPFEYYFYLDFKGSVNQSVSKNALNNLKEISLFLKVLGSYEESNIKM